MTIPPRHEPVVEIGLTQIYTEVQAQGDKLDKLTAAVGDMVAINRRLDQHHDRLNDHGSRLGNVETAQATAAAVAAAVARPRTHWTAVVGAIVAIVAGVGSLITVIVLLGQISRALAP